MLSEASGFQYNLISFSEIFILTIWESWCRSWNKLEFPLILKYQKIKFRKVYIQLKVKFILIDFVLFP